MLDYRAGLCDLPPCLTICFASLLCFFADDTKLALHMVDEGCKSFKSFHSTQLFCCVVCVNSVQMTDFYHLAGKRRSQ